MTSNFSEDAVHIEQLEMFAHVGVPDDERDKPQRVTVTITAWPEAGLHTSGDDIDSTINYAAIARSVRNVVNERRDKLIETLAEKISERLLRELPIRRLRIELRKFVLPDAAYVAVVITRDGLAN
jgi:FolB domain-containing protein